MAKSTLRKPSPDPDLTAAFDAVLPESLRPFRSADPVQILRVPGVAADVGDIVVHNDGDELTVCIGKLDHRHFEVYCGTAATAPERQREIAHRAAAWILDILAERVRFRLQYRAGRMVAGSSWDTGRCDGGRWLTRTDEVREYTWSGEKRHAYRRDR